MSKLEEIEKTVGKCYCEICLVKDGQVKYLLSLVKQYREALRKLSLGLDDYWITTEEGKRIVAIVKELLDESEGGDIR